MGKSKFYRVAFEPRDYGTRYPITALIIRTDRNITGKDTGALEAFAVNLFRQKWQREINHATLIAVSPIDIDSPNDIPLKIEDLGFSIKQSEAFPEENSTVVEAINYAKSRIYDPDEDKMLSEIKEPADRPWLSKKELNRSIVIGGAIQKENDEWIENASKRIETDIELANACVEEYGLEALGITKETSLLEDLTVMFNHFFKRNR